MIKNLLLLAIICLSTNALAQTGVDPNDYGNPPCPQNTTSKQYCFTNTSYTTQSGEFLCPMRVCLRIDYTPYYLSQCQASPLNTGNGAGEFCVTILPGETKCINIPVPSLPISQWYDVSLTVSGLANPGQQGTVIIPSTSPNGHFIASQRGGCGPELWRYFIVESFDNTNFNIRFDAM